MRFSPASSPRSAPSSWPVRCRCAPSGASVCSFSCPPVAAAALRVQVNKLNAGDFKDISEQRAYAEFLFCSLILHFVTFNFIG
jgi:hypothetical protein